MSVMLYKSGGETKIWGRKLQTKTVQDSDVEAHKSDGWYEHPHDVPEDGGVSIGSHNPEAVEAGSEKLISELYAHRARIFSALMHAHQEISWWSRKQSDGAPVEGFIVAGIDTPSGEVSYLLPEDEAEHLPADTEIDLAKDWNGYDDEEILQRLLSLRPEEKPKRGRKPKVGTDAGSD